MFAFQRIRAVLFYLSVAVFLIGLPFILSFALGYKFNLLTMKFTKTGIISLRSQPDGAQIYLNKKLLKEESPASIQELLPGSYNISLKLKGYYSWSADLYVEAGKVIRADKIILFPLRPNLQELNQKEVAAFRIYPEKNALYYLDQKEKAVYKSDLRGENFADAAGIPENFQEIKGWEVSPDLSKMFLFNASQIAVVYLESRYAYSDSPIFFDYPQAKILQAFWHSDSFHLVIVTNQDIEVIESRPQAAGIKLVKLNRENIAAVYNQKEDALYFTDFQRGADNFMHNNVYKLEISPGLFERMIEGKKNE